MKTFLEPFENLTAVESLREALARYGKVYDITGCADKAHLIFGIGHDVSHKLIVTSDELKARELYEEYRFYDNDVVYFPAKDFLFYQSGKWAYLSSPQKCCTWGRPAAADRRVFYNNRWQLKERL